MMEGNKLKITCLQQTHNTLRFSFHQSQVAQGFQKLSLLSGS